MAPFSELIERKLPTIPDLPGAYLMRDEAGEILYVGKARSLRKRLRQHFRENAPTYGWTQQLYARVRDIEYIVTQSELEAFILEANLIKEHKPRYNIRLTDDKSYPYLKLTEELYPRLMVLRDLPKNARVVRPGRPGVRRFHDPKRHEVHGAEGRVFGPYPDARSMWRVLRLVPQIFGLRSCRRALDGTPNGKPCLNFHIGRCVGPCRGLEAVPREEYAEIVRQTARFLDGRTDDILWDLESQMQAAAAELQFERAAKLRDKIRAVRRATEGQVMVATEGRDQDVVGVALAGDRAMVVLFEVRAGRLVKQDQYVFGRVKGRSGAEVLDAFLTQHYAEAQVVPTEVLLSEEVPDMGEWEELLSEARGTRVHVRCPQRGEKRRLTELAVKNAQVGLAALGKSRAEQQRAAQQSLADLAAALQLPAPPKRVECFDISTTQGKDSVGSQVVFTDGVPDKKAYRRYRMRQTEGKPDDFAMMAEMIRRRLRRGLAGDEKFLPLPDLILVDGGKGQLSTAVRVLQEEGLDKIPAAGLAKQEEEVFVPGRSEPVDMEDHPTAQFLLQRIRDEAHRFAITHHRGLRDSQLTRSALDGAPGIGPARRRELLRAFPSVQAMAHATVEELAAVKGMNRPAAEALLRFLTRVREEEDA
jgi:excinuclease ABC subunit C